MTRKFVAFSENCQALPTPRGAFLRHRISVPLEGYSAWIAVACISILSSLLITYVFTSLRVALVLRSRASVKQPPVHVYFLPFLGHAFSFVLDLKTLLETLVYVLLLVADLFWNV